MGIFGRFWSAGQAAETHAANDNKNKTDAAEQDAIRLIDAGNTLKAEKQPGLHPTT